MLQPSIHCITVYCTSQNHSRTFVRYRHQEWSGYRGSIICMSVWARKEPPRRGGSSDKNMIIITLILAVGANNLGKPFFLWSVWHAMHYRRKCRRVNIFGVQYRLLPQIFRAVCQHQYPLFSVIPLAGRFARAHPPSAWYQLLSFFPHHPTEYMAIIT